MKYRLILLSLILATPAYAQSSKATLTTEVNTNYPDNTTGAITPAILRSTAIDQINSWQQAPLVNAQAGTSYTIQVSDYGKMVTTSNGSAIAVTLPQATGSFATFNFYLKNLGVGTATITPTVSTINGTTSISVAQNESVYVVSDGTNYQVMTSASASISFANPTATVGCTTVNGAASSAMRSDAAPGLNLAASCTYTGNRTYAPSTGVAVTITGAPNSLSRAIDVAQTVSGSAGSSQQFNQFLFTDVANLGAFTGNGLNVQLNYGGGASQGNRQAIQAGVTLTSATNASNSAHFYVAGQFNAQANTADNGTNTGAGAKGAVIGINPACTLGASATNIAECAGIEITVQTLSGSSLSERSGLQISDISGAGGSQGATFDSAISMGNTASSPGWKSGIAFDATNYGSAPLDSTNGRAIEVIGSQTMKDFIYATNLTISGGNFITGPGSAFVVSGTGSGIGSTPSDSVILQNTSAASAGAQQFSPRLRFTGHGWRTNGGGASETVDWTIDNRPVQSTADPWTNLSFNVQLNAGGYTPHTTFIYGPSTNAPAAPSDANQRFMVQRNVNGESLYGVDAGGGVYAWCVTCTSTIFGTQVAVALDFFTNNVKRMEFAPTSTHLVFLQPATPALSSCGTSPTITSASTDIAGTVTTGTGTPAGCTITFNVAYISAPTCVVTWRGNLAAMGYATSTTAITLTQTAHDSSVIDYSCYGV